MVWRYRPPDQQIYETSGLGHLDIEEHRNTPVAVDGVLYYASPYNILIALDGVAGEEKWVFDPEVWKSGASFLGNLRGVTYWTDGEIERIFMTTSSSHLWSVDARTGKPDPGFGTGGRVDVGASLRRPLTDRDRWSYGITAAPVICRDVVAVGSAIGDWRGEPPEYYTPVGDVQAFDARTGKKRWEFHTVPQQGEYGNETWETDAWKTYGVANVWTSMTADEELDYIYLPVSSVSHDYYGGERPGDNLFGESIVCLDPQSGARVWHFQMVHHGLWDLDPPAPPILMDVVIDGRPRKIVAQLTKQAFCFVFDRVTGEPIWPIEERPVPQSTVEGEKTSPTQPFPTKPAALERQGIREDDLIDFTPELRAEAREILARYDYGPLYAPPTERGVLVVPGQWGGADWAGGAADPRTGILYVPTHMAITTVQLHRVGDPDAHSLYAATNEQHVVGPRGLPLVKPPYGSITAIDLNTGEHIWRTAVGKGPGNHPALRGLDLPAMGWDNRTFALTTPNLLLATSQDPHDLADAGMDYFVDRDAYLRANDLATGTELGRHDLPSNAYGAPMSYAAGGRQYVVVPVGNKVNGGNRPPELVALALPREGEVLPPLGRDRTDASHEAYYRAAQAIDAGDALALQKLLVAHPGLATARGYFDEWYEYPYFRGAYLLHHVAGEPQRAPLPPNPIALANVLIDAGADPSAATYDSVTVLELVAGSAQLNWAGTKVELMKALVDAGADPNRNRSRMLWVGA